jgi:AraC-like DNA-binding protein
MALTLFYTTNAAVLVMSLLAAWGIFLHGRRFNGDLKRLRQFVVAVFTVFALQRYSLSSIVHPEGIEVYASQPIVLLDITFIILVMGGTALMSRPRHYRNFTLWVLLLLIPAIFFVVNILMLTSGFYRPLFHADELLDFRHSTPIVFYGRMMFVGALFVFWAIAAGMLVEAYIHDRHERANRPLSDDAERHNGEVRTVLGWAALFVGCLVPMCTNSLNLHIIYNVILILALVLTAYAYWRLVCYLRARDNGRLAPVLIMRRVPLLLGLEQGGITPWGIRMDRNPFFSGNPMLDDVAQALGVRSADVSEYVASLKTNLVAWISDQRLRHCAGELALSNRKINEIALSCGYNDLPTFTRAFKRQFGLAPSEYRKKEQKPGSQQDSDPSTN